MPSLGTNARQLGLMNRSASQMPSYGVCTQPPQSAGSNGNPLSGPLSPKACCGCKPVALARLICSSTNMRHIRSSSCGKATDCTVGLLMSSAMSATSAGVIGTSCFMSESIPSHAYLPKDFLRAPSVCPFALSLHSIRQLWCGRDWQTSLGSSVLIRASVTAYQNRTTLSESAPTKAAALFARPFADCFQTGGYFLRVRSNVVSKHAGRQTLDSPHPHAFFLYV